MSGFGKGIDERQLADNEYIQELRDTQRIPFRRAGYNPNVGSSTEEVWDFGGVRTLPTTPEVVSVVSSSVNDTLLGTGARSVRIYGLDENYERITEDIDLNGTTPSTGTTLFQRVSKGQVLTSGSSTFNEGNIDTSMSSFSVQDRITIGDNLSHNLTYTVPDAYYLMITNINIHPQDGRDVLVRIVARSSVSPQPIASQIFLTSASGGSFEPGAAGPSAFGPPRADIVFEVTKLSGADVAVSGFMFGYLVRVDSGANSAMIDITTTF